MLWLTLLGIIVVVLLGSYAYNNQAVHRVEAEFPAIGQFVSVEGIRLHFTCRGSGQAIVLLHGNAGFLQDYSSVINHLARQYCVYAFDRPGHGYSDRPHDIATPITQAQLLHKALQTLGIKKPVLVGHSWGCAFVLAYALLYPKEILGIILLAPLVYKFLGVPLLPVRIAQAPALDIFLKFIPAIPLWRFLVRQLLKVSFSPASVPNDYLQAAQKLWTRPRQLKVTFQDSTTLQPTLNRISQHYGEIRAPITIVTGNADRLIDSEQNAHRLHRAIAHSRLVVLPNTGHAIPQTQPEAVVKAVQLCCSNDTLQHYS